MPAVKLSNTVEPRLNMKRCYECSESKALSYFYKSKCRSDGVQSICKKCSYNRFILWRDKNKEKYKAKIRIACKRRHIEKRKMAIEAYGGVCSCCGEYRYEFLSIDHIHGGGSKHKKLVGCGSTFYRWLWKNKYPKNDFRLLCHNCNQAIGYYGLCPHEKERGKINVSA